MSVDVMSRDSMVSSSSSPASAGVSPLGGSYMAATETPGSGSRPFHHQMANITRKDQTGRRTPGLPATNQTTCWVNQEGSFNTPLGIQTSMVRPERGGSGRLDPKLTKLPSMWVLASCAAEPKAPVKACALSCPAAALGRATKAEACSMGTFQSLPVAFQ